MISNKLLNEVLNMKLSSQQDTINSAKEFIELNQIRSSLYEQNKTDEAFDIECTQRDIGTALAEYIIELHDNKEPI